MKRQTILLTAIVISLLLLQPTFAALPRYEIIDLGTLGGNVSRARAINDADQVTGTSYLANGKSHAFIWDHINGMIDLGTLGSEVSGG
jgi:probable HAF family extracellular repeat protein